MNIQIIKERLEKIKKSLKRDAPIVFQHTDISNISEDEALTRTINQENILYMKFPKGIKTYIGYGIALKYEINTPEELLNLKNIELNTEHNEDNQKFFLLGAASFNMETEASLPWQGYSKGTFYTPKILFSYSKENSYLTYTKLLNKNFSTNDVINEIEEHINLFKSKKPTLNKKKIILSDKQLIPEKEDYIHLAQSIINKIHRGEIEKTVLARIEKHTVKNEISLYRTISLLNQKYPNCLNFLIEQKDKNYFLGSTPEKLIEVKDTKFNTLALAGTSKHKISLKRDKEVTEHNYVVAHLKKTLDPYVEEIHVERNAKPLKLDYAYHIQTPIEGQLKEKTHIIDILQNIYPTPALAGSPMKDSIDIISSIEKFDRGLYGGCVGLFNTEGSGNFYVPIRSALIKKNKIYLFSGSGIVEKSVAEKEWDETNLKLEHLKSVL